MRQTSPTDEPGSVVTASTPAPRSRLRVSVVAPTFNPGPQFDDLVASLLAQSLSPDQFEVLFCDDGSDEATQQRLTALEDAHPHFRVLRLPHSGWPGAPRNAGIEQARGDYLYFCDDDDRLSSEALERLCDYADEHGSDVVLGMLVGVGRWLNMQVFQRDIPHARLGVDPLLNFLTPHKLFRTAFIHEHGIRYPSGKVRLEDHQFSLQAYFEATTCSIYSSYPCYYWTVRRDRRSISSTRIDPTVYFRDMVQVLELVERHTNPSHYRDSLLQHWYRGKVLGRLSGSRVTRYPVEHRDNLIAAMRPLLERWFPPRIDALLTFPYRLRSALLRADDADGLVALGSVDGGLTCHVRATSVRWTADHRLEVDVYALVRLADGSHLRFEEVPRGDGGPPRQVWRPPVPIVPEVLTDEVMDASSDLAGDSIQVFLRDLVDQAIYPLGEAVPGARTTFTVDPRTARFGRPISRRSELLVEVHRAGWVFRRRIRVDESVLAKGAEVATRLGQRRLSLAQDKNENVLILTATRSAAAQHPAVGFLKETLPPPALQAARQVRRRLPVLGRSASRLRRALRRPGA